MELFYTHECGNPDSDQCTLDLCVIGTHLATSFGFVPAAFSLSGSGPHRGRHHSESEASDTGLPVGSDILRFQEQWLQLKYSND